MTHRSLPTTIWALLGLFAFLAPAGVRADEPAAKHAAPPVRVACVGDSITFGSGIKDRDHQSYPAQLQAMLGGAYEVKNFGVSGATLLNAGDNPYTKQKAFEAAKAFKPNIVVIKLGTNDSKPQNWSHKDEFAADAKAMVEAFQSLETKPRVYLCRPVPAYPGNWGIRDEIIKNEVIPLIDAAAKEKDAQLIDLYAALSDKPAMFPDKVHPNADGARVIAATVYNALTGREAPAAPAPQPEPAGAGK